MVHAERPLDSASAQVPERTVRRGNAGLQRDERDEKEPPRVQVRRRPNGLRRRRHHARRHRSGRYAHHGGAAVREGDRAQEPGRAHSARRLQHDAREVGFADVHGAAGVAQRVLHSAAGEGRHRRPQDVRRRDAIREPPASTSALPTMRSAIRRRGGATCRTMRRCARRSTCSTRAVRSANCSPSPASRCRPRALSRRRKNHRFRHANRNSDRRRDLRGGGLFLCTSSRRGARSCGRGDDERGDERFRRPRA